jgi:hypothetical protein
MCIVHSIVSPKGMPSATIGGIINVDRHLDSCSSMKWLADAVGCSDHAQAHIAPG